MGGLTQRVAVVMWRGNSGALLCVCRVRRAASALKELRETLAVVSWTYFSGGNAARIALSVGMWVRWMWKTG